MASSYKKVMLTGPRADAKGSTQWTFFVPTGVFAEIAFARATGEKTTEELIETLNGREDTPLIERMHTNENGEIDGVVERWSKKGELYHRAEYVNGQKHGLEEKWHMNGQLEYRAGYRKGQLHGLEQVWSLGGLPVSSTGYNGGQRHGIERKWYDSGILSSEIGYNEDRAHGLRLVFFASNGQLYQRDGYNNGKRNGLVEHWCENGQQRLIDTYDNGTLNGLSKTWDESSDIVIREGLYKNNRKDGAWYEEIEFGKGSYLWYEDGKRIVIEPTLEKRDEKVAKRYGDRLKEQGVSDMTFNAF